MPGFRDAKDALFFRNNAELLDILPEKEETALFKLCNTIYEWAVDTSYPQLDKRSHATTLNDLNAYFCGTMNRPYFHQMVSDFFICERLVVAAINAVKCSRPPEKEKCMIAQHRSAST